MKKRWIPLLLCIVIVFSLLSTTMIVEADDTHSHCTCGISHSSMGNHTSVQPKTWEKWISLDSLPSSGYYYLQPTSIIDISGVPGMADIYQEIPYDYVKMENKQIVVSSGNTLALCLNGKAIWAKSNDPIFKVESGGTLIITDCTGTGAIVDIQGDQATPFIEVEQGGNFQFYGGALDGNNGFFSQGIINSGTVYMYGGIIRNFHSRYLSLAHLQGGGIWNKPAGSLYMYSGGIEKCGAVEKKGNGVYNEGTFKMYGGTISECSNPNIKTEYGGGVYNTGTFTMEGGLISRCGLKEQYGGTNNGGGVYNDATFNFYGGTITGCYADKKGGGIYNNGTMNIKGKVTVSENVDETGTSNLYISKDHPVNLTGALNTNSSIGVKREEDTGIVVVPSADVSASSNVGMFMPDDDNCKVTVKDGNICLELAVLNGITVETAPTKTEYLSGEILDLSNMVVKAQFDNGISKKVKDYTVTLGTGEVTSGTTVLTSDIYTVNKTLNIQYTKNGVTKSTTQAISVFVPVTPPVAATNLKYTGRTQTGVATGTGYQFTGETNGYQHEAINVGNYQAKATLANTACYRWNDRTSGYKIISWKIEPAAGSVSITADPGKIYDGTGVSMNGKYSANGDGTVIVEYKVKDSDDSTYTTSAPVNAGDYTVRVTQNAGTNYTADSDTKDFTISRRVVTVSGITAQNKVYDGSNSVVLIYDNVNFINKLDKDRLTVTASGIFNDKNAGFDKNVTIENLILGGTDIANYKLAESGNQNSTKANITALVLYVENVDVKNKQYDGTKSAEFVGTPKLKGVLEGDEVALKNGIPSFDNINVGEEIEINLTDFSISGDDKDNYTLIQPSGIKANITNTYIPEKDRDYSVNTNDWQNTDFVVTALSGKELSLTNTADGTWNSTLTVATEGEGTLTFYVRDTATGAISLAATENYKIDKSAPETYDITYQESSVKKELNSINFGLFFNKNVDVKITASDNLCGVKTVEYFTSNTVLTEEEVEAITDWTKGSELLITAEDKTTFLVYVKVTDNVGNITYFGSEGAIFDLTDPKIAGVEEGKTYYTTQIAVVTDDNLDTVTLNGETVTGTTVTLSGNVDKTYTIIVKDKVGNETNVTVTMKSVQSMTEKTKNITADNVTLENRENLEAVKEGLKQELENPNLTEAEKEKLQEEVDYIDDVLEVLDNAGNVAGKIDELPDFVEPDDTDTEAIIKNVRENYDALTEHERELVGKEALEKLNNLETQLLDYCIVEGMGSSWQKGNNQNMSFTANGAYSKFKHLEIDGKVVNKLNYTVASGSTIITLKAGFLETLSVGEHTMQVFYNDNNTDMAKFMVKEQVGNSIHMNRENLEDLKEGLEQELENPNLTEPEKETIQEEVDSINAVLEALDNVGNAEGKINELPDSVEPDDINAEAVIKNAREIYDALTEYEKELVGEEALKKLKNLETQLLDYRIVEGMGGIWHKGSNQNMSFTANGAYSKFEHLEIDGKVVNKFNYTVVSGSTVITLKAGFLETLSVGEHTMQVFYNDSNTDMAKFTVNTQSEDNNPPAGNNFHMALWIALMFTGTIGIFSTAVYNRKRNTSR